MIVLLFWRSDGFAVYHAKQTLNLELSAIAVPIGWAVFAWLFAILPLAGPLISASTFGLVIAAFIGILIAWLVGIINSLRGVNLLSLSSAPGF